MDNGNIVHVSLDESATISMLEYTYLLGAVRQAINASGEGTESRHILERVRMKLVGNAVFLPGFWDIEGDRYSGKGV